MHFWKMQGVGNDFVLLDLEGLQAHTDLPLLATRVCARHFGIGADGLLVVSQRRHTSSDPSAPRVAMRMFNPDGSEDMCGNGLRCVGLWAHQAGWLGGQRSFQVSALDGNRQVRLLDVGDKTGILSDMGVPRLSPAAIPFLDAGADRVADTPIAAGSRAFRITAVNTGSTHTVIFGPAPDEETFQHYSPLLETHPLFPERTSIMWATPGNDNRFVIRIWERGAGETLGCGTGACAVGVAAQLLGLAAPGSSTQVVSKGGTLEICWSGEGKAVEMTGPAQFVYEGDLNDSADIA